MQKAIMTLLTVASITAGRLAPAAEPGADPTAAFRPDELPVRALMMFFPSSELLPDFLRFVREDLPREGVNHLVLQIDYGYQFKRRPELAGSVTEAEVKSVVAACREAGVRLIPLVNCLGHQSWAKTTHRLLTVYPEFDETPGLYPENEGIYCRSYCPNHPGVHAVIFDVLAEIGEVFEAKDMHVGLDEVFLIAEDDCTRCGGLDPAAVFAQEVTTLRNFLHGAGMRLWLWGDRFLDATATGLGEWEASMNNTHRAIDLVPRDIVVCDWHYEASPPTAAYFAMKGFDVVLCPWNRPAVAVAHADQVLQMRAANARNSIGPRLLGVMSTNWEAAGKMVASYRSAKQSGEPADLPSAETFIRLFEHLRKAGAAGGGS